ncbi:hypothetical protein MVES_002977 [Malassezia vespertilionis]|uniref:GYF domain-containing protein n=2 Tax=Malassezia vespertilionis TaxID=2020962 RepID=A0A2N1J9T1_9BASI|nr:hypothetical protein MVES_002977 [Malassezia vespertilionis]
METTNTALYGSTGTKPYWESPIPGRQPPVDAPSSLPAMMHTMHLHEPSTMRAPDWSPDTQQWIYLDPNGYMQGPFTGTAMQAWYEQQYLYADLLIRREEDTQFKPLQIMLAEIGDAAMPFLVPPHRYLARRDPPLPMARNKPELDVQAGAASPSVSSLRGIASPTQGIQTPVSTQQEAPASPNEPEPALASNLTAQDIATAMRVLTQLRSMMPMKGANESQITHMMEQALSAAMPHANAAGIIEMQEAMRVQNDQSAAKREFDTPASSADARGPIDTPQKKTEATRETSVPEEPVREAAPEPAAPAPLVEAKVPEKQPKRAVKAAEKEARAQALKRQPERETEHETHDAFQSAPAETPHKPEPKVAPWAASPDGATHPKNAPSLREIMEAGERERAARIATEKAGASARLAQGMQSQTPPPTIPAASSPFNAPSWNVLVKAAAPKSLAQIQREEAALAQRAKAAQAPRTAAYSSSAARGADSVRVHNEPWAKVGAHGKVTTAPPIKVVHKTMAETPAPAPVPARVPAPAPASVPQTWEGDGWMTKKSKGQARRDALSTMNDAIPRPTGSAAGNIVAREQASSSKPLPPSPEFLHFCREQLQGLSANIDDFIDMLLSFPLNSTPDVEEIIAETVYASSSTLDGRRFAATFLKRRKEDAFRAVAV